MSRLTARKIHEENLDQLRQAKLGEGNELLNSVFYFAGRLFAAGGFDDQTAKQVQDPILDIVLRRWEKPHPENQAHKTRDSGWNSGLAKPLVLEDKWPEVAAAIEELNGKFFAVHKFGGDQFRVCSFDRRLYARIGGWKQVLEVLVPQREKDFKLAYLNKRIKTGENPNGSAKIETKAEAWLKHKHRREFTRVVFLPGAVSPPDEFNLWRGFSFQPKKGDCSLYLEHLAENVCQDNAENYRWLIQWMAYQVRHPGDVGQSAIVVKGKKGTGKNIFAEGFANLWGQHGIVLGDTHSVTTNFNSHLRDKCVVVADEAFFAADPKQATLLKPLITGSMITIEYKGVNKEQVPNLLRLIIISNNEHVIPATPDERRYFVVTCGERHRRDSQYFGALLDQLNHGGYEALLYHLLHEVDLTGFDVHNPPMTDELQRQVELGLRGMERVWFEILRTGALPGYERLPDGSVKLQAADLAAWANKNGADRWEKITPNTVGNLLGTDKHALQPPMGFELKREKNNGAWYRVIPPLAEARKRWDELRGKCEWPRASGQGELQGESGRCRSRRRKGTSNRGYSGLSGLFARGGEVQIGVSHFRINGLAGLNLDYLDYLDFFKS